MDMKIIEFGVMEMKKMSRTEDETFHPDICLVAVELKSNYIIVEKYVEDRTSLILIFFVV